MAKDEDVKKDKKAEEGGEEEGEAPKKGGKFSPKALLANKKKLIMIVAPVILVIILGAVGYTLFLKPAPEPEAPAAADAKAAEPKSAEAEKAADKDGAAAHEDKGASDVQDGGDAFFGGKAKIFEMKPFVVNLQDNSGTRYLKLTIGIELDSTDTKKILKSMRPKVRNSLIILLSSKSYTEIGSIQGKYKLRDEIVERINHILNGDKVKTVYFIEFVVQ
ncbi:hypothetical protein MNBD_DELTA02-784 [hydrothermal vent metagenome]|uniref:Flagellar protein FliL n=1 Tax=hydrothermal vent metagenome TaxID=652676 RepID=A0A3B0UU84_9ZZZZ